MPFGFSVAHNSTVNEILTRTRRRRKSATKFPVASGNVYFKLLMPNWAKKIKLQKILHLKVVKKLYFWTKNITKTFSGVKFIEAKYLLLAAKTLLFLTACVQTRDNSNFIDFNLTVQDLKTLFGRKSKKNDEIKRRFRLGLATQ